VKQVEKKKNSFNFSDAGWPPKGHNAEITPCFGGEGVDSIFIDNIRIKNSDFIQIIKDFMTNVPISVCDDRLRLVEWFKSIETYHKEGNPFRDYFKGTVFDKDLGSKNR
jgi:hypothetical protein